MNISNQSNKYDGYYTTPVDLIDRYVRRIARLAYLSENKHRSGQFIIETELALIALAEEDLRLAILDAMIEPDQKVKISNEIKLALITTLGDMFDRNIPRSVLMQAYSLNTERIFSQPSVLN